MSFTPEQVTEILQIYFDNFVNQTYTGMRYVPIIGRRGESSAAWDNSEPYEPLTIVTYNNESYTSRQFVPAAADIADTDYWVKTGAYNAQIVALQDALPIAQFDSENTVKDYVDTLASFIPATDFDNDNTVKAYIDGVADLLPSSAFDSVNTVRGALNGRVRAFETVSDMAAADDLTAGMICHTNGFHTSGDGGAAFYEIKSTGTANAMDIIACQDSLLAHLVIIQPFVTPEQFGAYGDGVNNDTVCINEALRHHNVIFNNSYLVSSDTLYVSDASRDYYSALNIISNSHIILNSSATITQQTKNIKTEAIINIYDINNVLIEGNGKIIGALDSTTSSGNQWANAIYVHGSKNVTIKDINISKAVTDAITITDIDNDNSDNVTIDNVHVENSGRNNISLIGCDNVNITNSYIGAATSNSPYAGIDIEPNAEDVVKGTVNIVNCIINNPLRDGITGTISTFTDSKTYNITNCDIAGYTNIYANDEAIFNISNCTYRNGGNQIVLRTANSNAMINIHNLRLTDLTGAEPRLIQLYANQGKINIDGVLVPDTYTGSLVFDAQGGNTNGRFDIRNVMALGGTKPTNSAYCGCTFMNFGNYVDLETYAQSLGSSRYIFLPTWSEDFCQTNSSSRLYVQIPKGQKRKGSILNTSGQQCQLYGTSGTKVYVNGAEQSGTSYNIPNNTLAYYDAETAYRNIIYITTETVTPYTP